MKRSASFMASLLLLCALVLSACGQAGGGAAAPTEAVAEPVAPTEAAAAEPTSAPTEAAAEATTAPTEAAAEPVAPTEAAEATAAPTEAAAAGGGATIRVGSKNFTEVLIVGEMQALLLEEAGFTVERKLNLGATPVAHAALLAGEIDLYGEYTSTGLLEVLGQQPLKDAQAIVEAVRQGYEEQFQLTWLEPSPFNDTNAFATTRAVAEQYGLQTYSDLAAKASELRLGGPPEFPDREDTKGLYETYGGFNWKEFKQLGTGSLRYDALQNGEIDVVVAFGTDGRIKGDDLVLLQDDKNYYPIYQLAPVVRQDMLADNPAIADALNKLAPLLTDEVMSGLNYQVDGPDKRDFAEVARTFLQEQGLIQ